MSRFSLGLALALAAAWPAAAGTMLYATAATTAGVTGYCLGPNGAIMPDPIVNVQTMGGSPSRLITSPDGKFLYVAESNQTEVWEIGPNGFLTRKGQIPDHPPGRVGLKGINSHDIAIATSPDGQNVLYQPQRQQNRLAAFPLDPATGLSTGTPQAGTTCVKQTAPAGSAGWENLIVANGLVYASRSHAAGNGLGSGDVVVYKLSPNGDFDLPPAFYVNGIPSAVDTKGDPVTSNVGCPTELVPYSQRQRLNGAAPIILLDGIIYVGQRFRQTISAFQLCPNQFSAAPNLCPLQGCCPTGGFFQQPKLDKAGMPKIDTTTKLPEFKYRQTNLSRTQNNIRYNALALAGRTIIGAQFQKGRIDAFSLNADGTLPSGATRTTQANVATSPFRMFVSNGVLYVGAGSSDNVQAYRLDANGLPESNGTPFSETNTLRNTFPNDVIVVDISGSCD
jgi:6-phosphogluconolactonase (cycloisomerase 2 family)